MSRSSSEDDRNPDFDEASALHKAVMLEEVMGFMGPAPGKIFIDATGGPGNMSRALLEGSAPTGKVLSLDKDRAAFDVQNRVLSRYGNRSVRRLADFRDILSVSEEEGFVPADGVVYDLGQSSLALDDPDRGMSFMRTGPLDSRYDQDQILTAYDIVNNWSEKELAEIFHDMDEARFARRIAAAIVKARCEGPIDTTTRLAEIISNAVPRRFHPKNMHVATRPFLAIRVAVNEEKEALEESLRDVIKVLKIGGVLVVLCWSSFEDRIVKAAVRSEPYRWKKLTRKPVTPSDDEITLNPRSRSARLRAFARIA